MYSKQSIHKSSDVIRKYRIYREQSIPKDKIEQWNIVTSFTCSTCIVIFILVLTF